MPSAFAMFASAPPASAGSAAAAPGATDSETASLFSSNLADAIQGVKADAAKAEAAHRTPGRLSLPVISNPEMEAAETSDASPALAEAVDVAPDALIAVEAPTSDAAPDAAPDTEQTDTPVAPSDLAAAPQPPLPHSAPVAAPIVAPTTTSEPSLETAAAEDASVGQTTAALEQGAAAGVTVEPSAQQNATAATETALVEATPAPSPIPDAPAQTAINSSAETSAHEQSLAQNHEAAAAAPVAPDVDQTLAALAAQQVHAAASSPPTAKDGVTTQTSLPESGMTGQASADVKNASASAPDKSAVAADASIVKPAEKAATKPVSEPVQSAGASAVSPKVETAAPKMDVKVSIQSANLVAQPVQTVAVISSLAVAEAVKAIDAKVEVPTEPSDTGSAPVIATSQPAESAPAKAATTPVTNAAQPNPTSTKPAPAEASQGQNVAQPALGDHIAMADATPPPAQNAASTEAAPTGTVPVLDAAMTSLDPATPVDGATEARALDAATTTTQTTSASSLSRATVETTAHLAAQIARKLEGRSTRFDMVLTPEDLGRVDVSLEIGADGRLAARQAFDNPAAAAELRGRADELRRQLQDAGFQLASDSLDFTQRDTSSGGGFDRQQQQHQSLFARGARLTAQADLSIAPPQGAWTNHSQTRDRVDVRV